VAIGDVWRLTIKGLIGADDNQNVVHYQVTSGGGSPSQDAEALTDAWESGAMADYLACLSSVYSIETLSVRGVTHATAGFDLTVVGAGAIAGEVAPTQTSALINLRTAKFGRSFRGKTYLPALAESAVSNGSITPTEVGLIDAYMLSAGTIVSASPVVASFTLGVWSRELLEMNLVTGHFVSQFAATQRRRKPGVGA